MRSAAGEVAVATDPAGLVTAYGYDAGGRQATTTDADGTITTTGGGDGDITYFRR